MTTRTELRPSIILIAFLVFAGFVKGDDSGATSPPDTASSKHEKNTASTPIAPHRFWDTTNKALFLGVGGARALDFASTQSFRGKGREEILLSNSIVDNKPLFAAIEIAGTSASIGISYLFHRSGHHKVERWVSIVHISFGVGGSINNFLLKPRQPALPPP